MPDLCFYLCHIDIIPAQDLCITKRLIIIRLQLAVSFSECPCLLILTVASHPVAHTRFFRLLFRVFLRFLFQLFCAADHCFRAIPRCLCAHVQCACYLLPHIDKPSVRCLFDPDGCLPVYLKHVRGLSDAAVIRPSGAHNGSPSAVVKLRLLPVFPPFPAVEVLQILGVISRHCPGVGMADLILPAKRGSLHPADKSEPSVPAVPHPVDQPLVIKMEGKYIPALPKIRGKIDLIVIVLFRPCRGWSLRDVFTVYIQLIIIVRRDC